jgi:hypothetical protein
MEYVALTIIDLWALMPWSPPGIQIRCGAKVHVRLLRMSSIRYITVLKGAMDTFFFSCLMESREMYINMPIVLALVGARVSFCFGQNPSKTN